MATKRRKTEAVKRHRLHEVAMAICGVIYGGQCACKDDGKPRACLTMERAAQTAALRLCSTADYMALVQEAVE